MGEFEGKFLDEIGDSDRWLILSWMVDGDYSFKFFIVKFKCNYVGLGFGVI